MVNGSSIFSESPKMVDTDLAKHARTASSSCGLLLDFRHRGVATPYRRPARPARHGCRPGLPKGSGSVAGHLWSHLQRTPQMPPLRAQRDEAGQRVGCGCHNMINYQHHILSHIVVTRPQKSTLNGRDSDYLAFVGSIEIQFGHRYAELGYNKKPMLGDVSTSR